MIQVMVYKGTVKKVMDAKRISEKFVKRELVVSDATDKYPQTILFETHNTNCSLLDGIKENDNVEIHFQVRGKEYVNPSGEKRYFITLVVSEIFLMKDYQTKQETSSTPNN